MLELEPFKDANKHKANANKSRECYQDLKEMDIFGDDTKTFYATHIRMQEEC